MSFIYNALHRILYLNNKMAMNFQIVMRFRLKLDHVALFFLDYLVMQHINKRLNHSREFYYIIAHTNLCMSYESTFLNQFATIIQVKRLRN